MRLSPTAMGLLLLVIALTGASANAQTDVGLSLYGAFSGTANGNNIAQSPSNAAGGLLEIRHLDNPIFGFEGTYAFNRANQTYTYTGLAVNPPCPTSGCGTITEPTPSTVRANAHEFTADWVPSLPIGSFRPFGVLGVGLLLDVPVSGQSNTSTTTKPVYVYGAGLDWTLLPHLGLRFQYRGNLYHAPDLTTLYSSSGAFTQTAEPMIGVWFRL